MESTTLQKNEGKTNGKREKSRKGKLMEKRE